MAKSVPALVKPELLVWARDTAGYSLPEAAQKLGFSEERLNRIEMGAESLTFNQLTIAANIYKRPVAAFFLPTAPKKRPPPIHDFRLQQGLELEKYSPQLGYAIRNAQSHRQDMLDLAEETGEQFRSFDSVVKMDQPIKQVADLIRSLLGISLEDQFRWRKPEEALKNWKAAVENIGVLVFEVSRIPLREMRGFSIPSDQLPVIVLNGADAHSARVFTLFHEFTHLLLRDGGVCDLYPSDEVKSAAAPIEIFCNAVAGEFLVPEDDLKRMLPPGVTGKWELDFIAGIARDFSVSREVVLRRLLTLGLTTKEFYQEIRALYQHEFAQAKEKAKEKKSAGPSPAVMAVRNLGRPFVSIVLEAYAQNRISLASVSDYLGVKTRHLDRISELVGRRSA